MMMRYSYLTTRMMLLISTLNNSTCARSTNKYDSRTNTKILTSSLCVWSDCCSLLFAYLYSFDFFFVNATSTKTVNFSESLESFVSTYYKYFRKVV